MSQVKNILLFFPPVWKAAAVLEIIYSFLRRLGDEKMEKLKRSLNRANSLYPVYVDRMKILTIWLKTHLSICHAGVKAV